jgi:hypothetical protein
MNVDSAAVFLAGTILYCIGLIVILIAVVIANNVIHKYWKSFGWQFMSWANHEQPRFVTQEEVTKIAPHLKD